MCGIVGYVGRQDAAPILLAGLHRLEYRGYDSAGRRGRRAQRAQGAQGRRARSRSSRRRCRSGCAARSASRTRAGRRTASRATRTRIRTPTAPANIAVVHNGIIENAADAARAARGRGARLPLRDRHRGAGASDRGRRRRRPRRRRCARRCAAIEGTYGLAVIDARHPDRIVVARNGSPVVIGIGEREMFVASDVAALVRHTRQVVYLDDGELATIDADGYRTVTLDDRPTQQEPGGACRGVTRPTTAGALRALHAEGDRRAARGVRADAEGPPRRAVQHRAPRRPRT